jgi:hypothetical protein
VALVENPHQAELADHVAHVGAAELSDELAPDEPKTPLWLTALGGVLFLLLAIAWLATRPNETSQGDLAAAAASASASAVALAPRPPPAVAPPPPPPPPPQPPAPVVSAAGAARGSAPPIRGPKLGKGLKP